ncbi:FAD-dependent monooxygenase atmM [Colletotrichum higginsianum]|uniref:FAD-dependent monooxygenase atmM n=1 Tax=Colletotrichum higginsianum TaxID=80884 RepID=A0A4T0WGH9_9PEZI|nr:FAD-dependent monooxygenase atmM [Colletotrichum higginsianum]
MVEQLGIDYILLEAHDTIAPQLGASIGLLPNGLRILDQIGCYETIRDKAGDFYNHTNLRGADGRPLMRKQSTSLSEQLEEKTGYPCIFIDRQFLLQVLYDNIKDKGKILTSKRVTGVEVTAVGVQVQTQDGCTYAGDFLIGADGVHSTIRKEMWRLANQMSPGIFSPDEGSKLKASTKCIFGISPRPATFPHHAQDIHLNDNITETVTFRDLYVNRHIATLVPLQEHVFLRWHFRRIFTIGDSAHKVHPITAQGGNGAIESAAVLVNAISRRLDERPQGLSEEALEAAFVEVYERRYNRARDVVKQGEQMQSLTSLEGPFSGLLIRYLVPLFGDALFLKSFLKTSLAGPRIDKIDLPKRPHAVQFNDEKVDQAGGYSWVLWSAGALVSGLLVMFFY